MAAALPQLLLILSPAVAAVLILLLASAPAARAHASSSSSATYRCGWCPSRSTASLLPPDAGAITGPACGYGGSAEMAVDGGFHIAAVSDGFFRKGRACGACYQVRCRGRSACAKDGVKVVVVGEVAHTNKTAAGRFLLTKDGFAVMTTTDHAAGLAASMDAPVDVDFRRIPCVYKSKNLAVRVEETSSRERGHLALQFLYQGGQTDIVAVEVAQAVTGSSGTNNDAAPLQTSWLYMTRREGSPAVWRTSRAPAGPLTLRLVVTAGSGGKWLRAHGVVLPAEWQPGAVYDTGLRVTDVAANTCGGGSCNAAAGGDDEEFR